MVIALVLSSLLIVVLLFALQRSFKEKQEILEKSLAFLDINKKFNMYLLNKLVEINDKNPLSYIEKWRTTFNLPVRKELTTPPRTESDLAISLIEEELNELKEAIEANDTVEIADAIGDLFFVVRQAACVYGIDVPKVVEEIYKSNMSKVCYSEKECIERVDCTYDKVKVDGKDGLILKRKSDGKVQKPSTFVEPDLKTVLDL